MALAGVWQWGPFTVEAQWVYMAVAAAAGLGFVHFNLRRAGDRSVPVADIVLTGCLIWIAVWKWGGLLFEPALLWRQPSVLLYMRGGLTESLLGTAAAGLYGWVKIRRLKLSFLWVADRTAAGIAIGLAIYQLTHWRYGLTTDLPWGISIESPDYAYHPVNAYALVGLLPLGVRLWRNSSTAGQGTVFGELLLYGGALNMLISFFSVHMDALAGLSFTQWFCVASMVAGLILLSVSQRSAITRPKSGEFPT